jgi:hypothetical protein
MARRLKQAASQQSRQPPFREKRDASSTEPVAKLLVRIAEQLRELSSRTSQGLSR